MPEPVRSRRLPAFLALVLPILLPGVAEGQAVLPLGETVLGTTTPDAPSEYRIEATEAGFLTVVVRGRDDADLRLRVSDADGQLLPGGQVDVDEGGDLGAEQVVVGLPRAGTYRLFVESYGMAMSSFTVGGSFLPTAAAARPEDPDGAPSRARSIEVGQTHTDALDPEAGDPWDWFALSVDEASTLTILTRTEEGDLSIEVYREGSYGEPAKRVDNDEGGVVGNESATVDVAAGETVYIKIGPPFERGGALGYTLRSGLIPR